MNDLLCFGLTFAGFRYKIKMSKLILHNDMNAKQYNNSNLFNVSFFFFNEHTLIYLKYG